MLYQVYLILLTTCLSEDYYFTGFESMTIIVGNLVDGRQADIGLQK